MQIELDLGYNYKIIQSQHYHPDSWSWIVRIFESPHNQKYEYYWTEYRSYKSLYIIVCICQKYCRKVITCIKLNNKVLKPEMMTYTVDQFVSRNYSVCITNSIILWSSHCFIKCALFDGDQLLWISNMGPESWGWIIKIWIIKIWIIRRVRQHKFNCTKSAVTWPKLFLIEKLATRQREKTTTTGRRQQLPCWRVTRSLMGPSSLYWDPLLVCTHLALTLSTIAVLCHHSPTGSSL